MELSNEELAEQEALRDLSKDMGRGRFKVTKKYIRTQESLELNRKLRYSGILDDNTNKIIDEEE